MSEKRRFKNKHNLFVFWVSAQGDSLKSSTNGAPLNSSYNGRFHGLGSKCLITRVTVTVREKPCVTLWVGIPWGFSKKHLAVSPTSSSPFRESTGLPRVTLRPLLL